MNKHEMLRLQGIDPTQFVAAVPECTLGQQIGNAMSVNVIERILVQVLQVAGFTRPSSLEHSCSTHDRWENGKGFESIRAPQRKVPNPNHGVVEVKQVGKHRVTGKIMSLAESRQLVVDSGASYHLVPTDQAPNTEVPAAPETEADASSQKSEEF